jgi:hypothetical protein
MQHLPAHAVDALLKHERSAAVPASQLRPAAQPLELQLAATAASSPTGSMELTDLEMLQGLLLYANADLRPFWCVSAVLRCCSTAPCRQAARWGGPGERHTTTACILLCRQTGVLTLMLVTTNTELLMCLMAHC